MLLSVPLVVVSLVPQPFGGGSVISADRCAETITSAPSMAKTGRIWRKVPESEALVECQCVTAVSCPASFAITDLPRPPSPPLPAPTAFTTTPPPLSFPLHPRQSRRSVSADDINHSASFHLPETPQTPNIGFATSSLSATLKACRKARLGAYVLETQLTLNTPP